MKPTPALTLTRVKRTLKKTIYAMSIVRLDDRGLGQLQAYRDVFNMIANAEYDWSKHK